MATQAHCAFCFESLAAHFEGRKPLPLAQVEEYWEQYHATKSNGNALGGDGESEAPEAGDDAEMTDADTDEPTTGRPAAISRLINRDTSASSSSSSLPSTKSATSSIQSASQSSGAATPASSESSRSSLLSFSRKQHEQKEEYPLFVTWNTVSSRSGHESLRGCIGTFAPLELEHGLKSFALTSALEDDRFQPIPASLLPSLSTHVTLLTNFSSPTKDPMDWTIGKHGLRISFTYHGRRYGSTYLPDVAKEQGWTKEDTLISLMRKAGWNGGSSSWLKTWRDGKGELVTYEGKQVGLLYSEWKEWKDWMAQSDVAGKSLQ